MKNISHKVVYLTLEGASRLFGNEAAPKIAGLAVVTTDPTLSDNTVVYGDTYVYPDGHRIGGILSEDAFTEKSFGDVDKAYQAFLEHDEMLRERFGSGLKEFGDVNRILSLPTCEKIPTLEERVKAKKFFSEILDRSPVSLEDIKDVYNKYF